MWRIAFLFCLLVGVGVHVVHGRGRRWDIWAITPNIPEADSDANVYVILIDNHGRQSPPLYLDDLLWNDFEKNSQDHFIVYDVVDIQDVCSIKLYRDNSGYSPAWFLGKMWMISGKMKKYRNFPCNCWVPGENEEKLVIQRVPPCSAGTLP